eukprot:gene57126-76286_t
MSSPPIPSAPGASPPPRLQLVGITKRYPAVVANSGVSLTVLPGEIHAAVEKLFVVLRKLASEGCSILYI